MSQRINITQGDVEGFSVDSETMPDRVTLDVFQAGDDGRRLIGAHLTQGQAIRIARALLVCAGVKGTPRAQHHSVFLIPDA